MRHIIFILVLICSQLGNAQIDFEKGYFIDNQGDKKECFIKNIDWKDNPVDFEYKINLADNTVSDQTISNVKEFVIENVCKYKRFNTKLERSSDNIKNISNSKDPIWNEGMLFLKTLIEGDATLYSYTEGDLFKYFYETKTIPLEQLVRIKFFSTTEDGSTDFYHIKENNKFRGQLFNALKCNVISEEDFKALKYDKTSLLKIFTKFNDCKSTPTVNFEEKNNTKNFNLKITSGVNQSFLFLNDPNKYYNSSTNIKKTVFQIGTEIEYILPYNKNRWSVFVNPSYQNFSAKKTFVRNPGFELSTDDVEVKVNAKYSNIEFPFGIRYYFFLNNNSKIFINTAYVFNFFGKSKFEITNGNELILNSGSRNNMLFGAGYNFKKSLSMEIRFNSSRQILSDYISWSAKYGSVGVVMGYKLL